MEWGKWRRHNIEAAYSSAIFHYGMEALTGALDSGEAAETTASGASAIGGRESFKETSPAEEAAAFETSRAAETDKIMTHERHMIVLQELQCHAPVSLGIWCGVALQHEETLVKDRIEQVPAQDEAGQFGGGGADFLSIKHCKQLCDAAQVQVKSSDFCCEQKEHFMVDPFFRGDRLKMR